MGKKKKKIARLTEEQYNAYIMSIKDKAAAFDAKGELVVPPAFQKEEEKKDY